MHWFCCCCSFVVVVFSSAQHWNVDVPKFRLLDVNNRSTSGLGLFQISYRVCLSKWNAKGGDRGCKNTMARGYLFINDDGHTFETLFQMKRVSHTHMCPFWKYSRKRADCAGGGDIVGMCRCNSFWQSAKQVTTKLWSLVRKTDSGVRSQKKKEEEEEEGSIF